MLHNGRLVNPSLAVGFLLYVGINPTTFAVMVFGYPETIVAHCTKTDDGLDLKDSVAFTYHDGRMAVLTSGMMGLLEALRSQTGIRYPFEKE